MHLKYFEWKRTQAPARKIWDPKVNVSRVAVRNQCEYMGPVRPQQISPARWSAMVAQVGYVGETSLQRVNKA